MCRKQTDLLRLDGVSGGVRQWREPSSHAAVLVAFFRTSFDHSVKLFPDV